MGRALSIVFAIAALVCGPARLEVRGQAAAVGKKGEKKQMNFPPHPGKIKMVDLSTGSEKDVPYEQAPEHSRFVYLDKNGAETSDIKQATERIPIVLVEMMPVDEHGNLTHRDKAKMLRIQEFGPDRRPLRSTTLVPNNK